MSMVYDKYHRFPIRVACIGDSITAGDGVKDRHQQSYPAQLAALCGDDWNVRNFGVNGTTALKKGDRPYTKEGAFQTAVKFQPDIVIVNFGLNDAKPHNWFYKEDFVRDYIDLIDAFRDAGRHSEILICYPTPVFSDRYGINDTMVQEELFPLITDVINQTCLQSVDLRSPLNNRNELFPDTVHPNAQGNTIIAATVFAAIAKKKAARD